MKRWTKVAIGLGAAITLGVAAVAHAHPYGYGPGMGYGGGPGMMSFGGGPGMGRGPGMGSMGMGRFGPGYGNPAALADARLAWLKSELKITPAQEPAWKTFADQAKLQSEAMQAWRSTMQGSARQPRSSVLNCATRS